MTPLCIQHRCQNIIIIHSFIHFIPNLANVQVESDFRNIRTFDLGLFLHPVHRRTAAVLPEQGLPVPAHLQLACLALERLEKRLGVEERLDHLNLQLLAHGDAAQTEHFHNLQQFCLKFPITVLLGYCDTAMLGMASVTITDCRIIR